MNLGTNSAPGGGDRSGRRDPIRTILAAVGLTLAALLASTIGGVALAIPLLVLELDIQSVPVFLGLTVAGQLGFVLVAYGYARYADLRVRVVVPDRRDVAYVLGGTLVAFVLAIVLSAILALLGLLPGSVIAEAGMADPTLFIGLAVLSVVLIAPAEEFLFRGVIQTRFRRTFGPAGAIAGASLLFGSLHLANYTGSAVPIVAGALLIAVVGAVFGVLYERTSNLVVPILAHGAYNVVLFVLAFLGS